MYINSSIFADAININDKIQDIKDYGNEDAVIDAEDDYYDIKLKIAKKDADPEDLKSKDYDEDDLMDDTWGDGALQLWFVPDNSMLASGLRDYYNHVDNKIYDGYLDEIPHFARDGVVVSANDEDNPSGEDGFYFATGLGYSIDDDLFIGVPLPKKHHSVDGNGSGVPARRFLYFLNYEDNDGDAKHRKLMQKNDYNMIK